MFNPWQPEGNNTINPIDWWISHSWWDCKNCTENTCSNKTLSSEDRNYCDEAITAIEKLYDREKSDLEEKVVALAAQVEWLAGVADFSLAQDRLADQGIEFWRTMKNTPREIMKAAREATRSKESSDD